MSTNPTSFRLPFTLPAPQQDAPVHPEVASALRYAFSGLKDLNDAIAALTPKVNANAKAVATVTKTVVTPAAASSGGGSTPTTAGAVNNQSGNTSYIIQQSDFGAIIIVNTASAFALDLSLTVGRPFYCVVENLGTGTITATPDATGSVNGGATTTLTANASALFFFDGRTNWYMTTLPALAPIPLTGQSANLGGSGMTAGQTITAAVAITGAAVGMVPCCSPETYPGDGFVWDAYISGANTVTVRLTCVLTGTPTASKYDVRVNQ